MAHARFDACVIIWAHMYHRSLGCQKALFIPCMYGEKSGGSRAFDLLPGTLLQPLSCAEKWITHPCLASLPTLVWTCPYVSWAYKCKHARSSMQVFYVHLEKANTCCMLLRRTCSQGQIEACGTAPGEQSANETFQPLDLSAGVPLNSAYNPSVHPAPLCAPLCSQALHFCQGIH